MAKNFTASSSEHTAIVGGKSYLIRVVHKSKTVWESYGPYGDIPFLEAKGRSFSEAARNWEAKALHSGGAG